jgi:hypothetical protein
MIYFYHSCYAIKQGPVDKVIQPCIFLPILYLVI